MNEHETDRIAAAAHQLRPDWPTASIRTILRRPELADRPRRDVAVAIAWIACENATHTPARVLQPGPWWNATKENPAETTQPRQPPKPADECGTHIGEWADNCRACAADRNTGCRPPSNTGPSARVTEHAAAIREILRNAGSIE